MRVTLKLYFYSYKILCSKYTYPMVLQFQPRHSLPPNIHTYAHYNRLKLEIMQMSKMDKYSVKYFCGAQI